MSFWFEYVESRIDTDAIRELAKLEDNALKFVMASWICNIAGGIELPTKSYKTELAKRLLEKNKSDKTILSLTGISRTHLWRLKKERHGQN